MSTGSRLPSIRFSWSERPVCAALITIVMGFAATSAFARQPKLTLSLSSSVVTNQGQDAVFTINASSPPKHKLFVNFFVAGTAILNRDYVLVAPNQTPAILRIPQITFPAGQSSVDVVLHTMESNVSFGMFATFFIEPSERYRIGHPSRATVTIENLK